MKAQEFIGEIGAAPPALVYLFCPGKTGKARFATFEPKLAERAVEGLVNTYVDPSLKDFAYTAFYADEADPADIVVEAQTLPFLAERRVVLVRGPRRADRARALPAGQPVSVTRAWPRQAPWPPDQSELSPGGRRTRSGGLASCASLKPGVLCNQPCKET